MVEAREALDGGAADVPRQALGDGDVDGLAGRAGAMPRGTRCRPGLGVQAQQRGIRDRSLPGTADALPRRWRERGHGGLPGDRGHERPRLRRPARGLVGPQRAASRLGHALPDGCRRDRRIGRLEDPQRADERRAASSQLQPQAATVAVADDHERGSQAFGLDERGQVLHVHAHVDGPGTGRLVRGLAAAAPVDAEDVEALPSLAASGRSCRDEDSVACRSSSGGPWPSRS